MTLFFYFSFESSKLRFQDWIFLLKKFTFRYLTVTFCLDAKSNQKDQDWIFSLKKFTFR